MSYSYNATRPHGPLFGLNSSRLGLLLLPVLLCSLPSPSRAANCTSFTIVTNSSQSWFINGGANTVEWSFVPLPGGCSWTAANTSSNPAQIVSFSPSSGLGAGTILASIAANATAQIQTGSITLTSGAVTFVLSVSQNPVSCQFTASPTGLTPSAAGGTFSLTITPNLNTCGWYLLTQQSWVQTVASEQVGKQTVSIVVGPNSGSTRTGSVYTYGSVSDISIPIVQGAFGSPSLIVSSTSVSGSGSIGTTSNLTPTPVSITSSNSTQIGFSVTTQTANSVGPDWLTVSLGGSAAPSASGTTPASLTIYANLQGLAPGTYTGTVTVTPTSNSSNGPQTIAVSVTAFGVDSLQVTYSPNVNQTLQLSYPSSLSGSVQVTDTALQGLFFAATGSYTSPSGGSWLQVTQNGKETNASVSVSAQRGNLGAGTYTGRVDIRDTNNNITSVTVVFVIPQPPAISAACSGCSGSGSTGQTGVAVGTVTVTSSDYTQPISFTVSPSTANAIGPSWLVVSESSGATNIPGQFTVSLTANLTGLAQGTYAGTVTITPTSLTSNGPQTVTATVTVINGTLQVTWTAGQAQGQNSNQVMALSSPSTMSGAITVSASTAKLNYSYQVKSGACWLQVSPPPPAAPGFSTQGVLTVTASPAGAAACPQPYQGRIDILDSNNNPTSVTVTLTVTGVTQTISHTAVAGGWQTSIILVNMDTVPAQYNVNWFNDDGTPATIPLASGSALAGTIMPGFSQTIQTAGLSSADVKTGWAQVVSGQQVGGTAIFRELNSGQEAAVPLLASGGSKLLLPFDIGPGLALGIGLANPNQTVDAQITLTMRTEQGTTIPMTITNPNDPNGNFFPSAQSSLTLTKLSHRSFLAKPLNAAGEVRGVIEFDSNVPIGALGIRYNGLAFTSIDAVPPQPAGAKTISHVAYGGGWQTTIIPVNTDVVNGTYGVNFWNEAGTPVVLPLASGSTQSALIAPGFSATVATAGLSTGDVQVGWAQMVSNQQIGGTAIFRETNSGQEAAVPLLASGSTRLLVPFDVGGGFALGIGMANPNQTADAQITLTMRTEQGTTIPMTITDPNDPNGNFFSSAQTVLTLARLSHRSFLAKPLNATGEVRGVIEFDSNVPICALGIRYNGVAFTSIRALGN